MKVLIVNTNHIGTDGITNVVRNLFCAMDKTDIRMDLAVINEPPAQMRGMFEAEGGRVYVLHRSVSHLPQYINTLRRVLKQGAYDAVHVHGNSATMALEMVAAWLAGCKVRIAHGHSTSCKSMTVHRLLTPVFQALCTHRLACGVEAGKWLHGKRSFSVVNNGIDTARFAFSKKARESVRQQYGYTESDIIIGHVGLFNEVKNQSFIVEILSKLDGRYKLMLVGGGRLRQMVEEKVAAMGLTDRVTFVGVTDRVPDYLSACDLIVMPSLYEGLPLALVEQQTNGLQCIVSDNITREADKTGNLIFLPLSAGAQYWADAVQALQLPDDREEACRVATEKIKACGYDIRTEAAKMLAYYKRAVAE